MGEHILTVPPLSPHTLLTFTGTVLVFYLDTLTLSRAVQGLLSSLIHYHNCYSRQARHSSRPPPGSRGTA